MKDYWKKLRERNPEKYKEVRRKENRRYLEKKLQKALEENREEIETKLVGALKIYLNKLTRIQFGEILPKKCEVCGNTEDLHIHHKRYTYPIQRKDLIRLCRRCHNNKHSEYNY